MFIEKCYQSWSEEEKQKYIKATLVNEQYVFFWQDFTQQYGLNYLLNSGEYSELFNDNTYLIESPNSVFFDYYDR